MCAKRCAKFFFANMCKIIFANYLVWLYIAMFSFSFHKLLMSLWNSFANSWDLKIYFLKGIVELERYEAWRRGATNQCCCPIKCGNAETCRVRQSSGFICFRLQLISIWQFVSWRFNTVPKTLPHWKSKIILRGGNKFWRDGQNFLSGLEEIYFTILPTLAHISIENWDYLVAMFEKW
jgi:hypothetical protein